MLASIIIATRNRSIALGETLQSLDRVRAPAGLSTEVIVVDNGSSDTTRHCATSISLSLGPVRYLYEPRPGKSHALNTALAMARGAVLAFLDDDVRPESSWLEQIVAPIVDRHCDAVAGAVGIAPNLRRPWMKPAHLAWLAETNDIDAASPKSAVGANMAVARRVLDRVPCFEPELGPGGLGLWEDTIFIARLLDAGYRLNFIPGAKVEHHFDPARLSRESFLAHAQKQGRSSAYVAWHWDRVRDLSFSTRHALSYRLLLFAKRLLQRRDWVRTEGVALWEMDLTCGIAFADQFRIERFRPRAYRREMPLLR